MPHKVILFGLAMIVLCGSDFSEEPLSLTYVANMGVLVESGGAKVLIDALFDKPNPVYLAPDAETLDRIVKAAAPFDGIDLALVTHNHPDHFAPGVAIRFLEASTETILMAPADAVAEMRKAEADWPKIESRVIAIDLPIGKNEIRTAAGIHLTVVRTLHDSSESPMNLMYLFDLNGRRIFHKGDSPGIPEVFRGFGLEAAPVDLAVIHYWFPFREDVAKLFRDELRPNHIALTHLPIKNEAKFTEYVERIRPSYKDIFLLLPGMPEKILLNSK